MRIAIYPGTFDPVTHGHLDIINRATKLFDKLIIGVAQDTGKNTVFEIDERLNLIKNQVTELTNVEVKPFSGLLVNFAKKENCCTIIRGIRVISDFEYEFQLSLMNKKLAPDLETVFLMTSSDYLFLSSSIIKQVSSLGGCIEGLVPADVAKALYKKLKGSR
ncbi:pantetheine-phosphate adenylyltransferase [Desulfitibacter alkalitolerans]|uniref:pantetheine-phosphate adenylyltransferase n=1 Tax=Desulfitibacter alkalitolerans TaxID=264641 RepID=UPI00048452B3|nr:pantetheine-phosphate adenylyltransferase [Desulfitibacter alkalitolerans]